MLQIVLRGFRSRYECRLHERDIYTLRTPSNRWCYFTVSVDVAVCCKLPSFPMKLRVYMPTSLTKSIITNALRVEFDRLTERGPGGRRRSTAFA